MEGGATGFESATVAGRVERPRTVRPPQAGGGPVVSEPPEAGASPADARGIQSPRPSLCSRRRQVVAAAWLPVLRTEFESSRPDHLSAPAAVGWSLQRGCQSFGPSSSPVAPTLSFREAEERRAAAGFGGVSGFGPPRAVLRTMGSLPQQPRSQIGRSPGAVPVSRIRIAIGLPPRCRPPAST